MTRIAMLKKQIIENVSWEKQMTNILWVVIMAAITLVGCTATTTLHMSPINIYEGGKIAQIDTGKIEKLPLKSIIVLDENKTYTHMEWAKGALDDNIEFRYPVGKLLKNSVGTYFVRLLNVEKITDRPSYDHPYDLVVFLEVRKMRSERYSNYGIVTVDMVYKLLDSNFSWISPYIEITAKGKSEKASFFTPLDHVFGLAAANAVDEGVKGIVLSLYKSLKHPEQLLSLARKVVAANPAHVEGYLLLGNVSNKYGHYDDAVSASRRAAELQPDNDAAYLNMGHAYAALKKYDDAITAYRKATDLNPNNIMSYFELSNIYMAKEDFDNAITVNKRALEIAPDNAQIPFAIGSIFMMAGKFDNAIEAINKAIALKTVTGIGTNIAVEDNYPVVKGLTENAPAMRAGIQAGDRIVKINGQSTKGWDVNKSVQNIKGAEGTQVTLTIERKGEKIEKSLKRETVIFKDAAPFFGQRSLAYRGKGNLEHAVKDAEQAYSLDANDDGAKRAMSITYIDKGKYNDALKILSKMKDRPFDRMLEATAYAKLGEMKKAVEIYTSIPEDYLASKSVLRQSYKKALLASLTPYANAKKDSAKSFEAKGQYRDALMEYAEILKISDENDAKDVMQRAALIIKANPRVAELPEEARRHVMRAEVSTKEGKFEDAIREYKEAAKVAPFFPALYKAVALNCAELKLYRQAINNLKTYLALSPDAPDARTARDEIYKWEFMMEKGGK